MRTCWNRKKGHVAPLHNSLYLSPILKKNHTPSPSQEQHGYVFRYACEQCVPCPKTHMHPPAKANNSSLNMGKVLAAQASESETIVPKIPDSTKGIFKIITSVRRIFALCRTRQVCWAIACATACDIPQRRGNRQPATGNWRNDINGKALRLACGSIVTVYWAGGRYTVLASVTSGAGGRYARSTYADMPVGDTPAG